MEYIVMDNTEQFVKIPCKVFKPQAKLKYWCNKCDQNAVDSDDVKSGNFFIQCGHTQLGKSTNYEHIVFAICHECAE